MIQANGYDKKKHYKCYLMFIFFCGCVTTLESTYTYVFSRIMEFDQHNLVPKTETTWMFLTVRSKELFIHFLLKNTSQGSQHFIVVCNG